MPLVEAVSTIWAAWPRGTLGATTPGTETLAGASMACAGTVVPSGSAPEPSSPATAEPMPDPAMLAVHAAESTASGTSAVALCMRPNADICWSPRGQVVLCRRSGRGLPRARVSFQRMLSQ